MSTMNTQPHPYRYRYTDLMGESVGGEALACSDEWFGDCANLVKEAAPIFKEGYFVESGQWMDGWESRRSFGRAARANSAIDYDWCVLKLGIAGTLHGADIETTHFRGNAPEYAALEGAWCPSGVTDATDWIELVPKCRVEAHAHNLFEVLDKRPCTHLRLKMFPDGGVARLRAWGSPRIERENFVEGELVDLASVLQGGRGVLCSDEFYSSPSNLLMPQPGTNMGDGWETRRRRDTGNDWCIIRLGMAGNIRKVVLDTAHFKGNYPDRFSLQATHTERGDLDAADIQWELVIGETPLQAHQLHQFASEILVTAGEVFTHVRLNIYPDGGVSRLRILGEPAWGESG